MIAFDFNVPMMLYETLLQSWVKFRAQGYCHRHSHCNFKAVNCWISSRRPSRNKHRFNLKEIVHTTYPLAPSLPRLYIYIFNLSSPFNEHMWICLDLLVEQFQFVLNCGAFQRSMFLLVSHVSRRLRYLHLSDPIAWWYNMYHRMSFTSAVASWQNDDHQ